MTTLDIRIERLRSAAVRASEVGDAIGTWIKNRMPAGLYPRSILIIIAPMVILQSVVAFVFMERHWNTVTRRLSAAVTQDISALIDTGRLARGLARNRVAENGRDIGPVPSRRRFSTNRIVP